MSLYPVGEVRNETNKARIGLAFYDSNTSEIKFLTLDEMRETSEKIIGVTNNKNLKMYEFFKDIQPLGDNYKESWTVFQRILCKGSQVLGLVDAGGDVRYLSRDEVVNLIKSGTTVLGCSVGRDNRLLISSQIETAVKASLDTIERN